MDENRIFNIGPASEKGPAAVRKPLLAIAGRRRTTTDILKLPRYHLKANERLTTFEFISEGPRGLIHKLIQFTPTNLKGVYNLSFGDRDEKTGGVNDSSISNNRDSEKVLATVVASDYAFTDKFPDAFVYATGSTRSRTRLYRMGIAKYYQEVKKDFEIYGETGDDWEVFDKDKDYEGFLVRRKKR